MALFHKPTPKAEPLEQSEFEKQVEHIIGHLYHCEKYLDPLVDPAGKSVLIIGCGQGTEALWCVEKGASEIVGIDLRTPRPEILKEAVNRRQASGDIPIDLKRMDVKDVHTLNREFDIILSNNVWEHLPDIGLAFDVCRRSLKIETGRLVIFTAPLYYSSHGSHIKKLGPWGHLLHDDSHIKEVTTPRGWAQFTTLNKMTLVDFVQAVEANGLIIEQLKVQLDRRLEKLEGVLERIDSAISPTNLTVEGISASLMRIR